MDSKLAFLLYQLLNIFGVETPELEDPIAETPERDEEIVYTERIFEWEEYVSDPDSSDIGFSEGDTIADPIYTVPDTTDPSIIGSIYPTDIWTSTTTDVSTISSARVVLPSREKKIRQLTGRRSIDRTRARNIRDTDTRLV